MGMTVSEHNGHSMHIYENTAPERPLPHNLEMEQALLGAILTNNEAFAVVADFLRLEHFYEGVHGRIYDACQALIMAGKVASPVTVKTFLEENDNFKAIGGGNYLARLTVAAVTVLHTTDYGRLIFELATRRRLILIAEKMSLAAGDVRTDQKAEDIIHDFEAELGAVRGVALSDKTDWDISDSLEATMAAHDRLSSGEDEKSLIPYGIKGLDDILGGIPRGEYGVVGARPAMGKSTLACVVAINAAMKGYGVGMICPDMGHRQVSARLVSTWLAITDQAHVPYEKILKGRLDMEDMPNVKDAYDAIRKLPIKIDDKANPTVANIVSRSRDWQRKFAKKGQQLDLLLVDHIHNLKSTKALRSRGKTEQVGEISNDLKAAARDLDVGMLAFAQLSREEKGAEVRRPGLDSLRWAGEIEQDVRWAIFLHRPVYYLEKNKPDVSKTAARADWEADMVAKKNIMELIVAKQNNGATGIITARCDLPINLIKDGGK